MTCGYIFTLLLRTTFFLFKKAKEKQGAARRLPVRSQGEKRDQAFQRA